LSQLRAFRVVAETLNFTRAAERLYLTQSAVSHQIKALETDLGEPLFIRAKRGVKLSQAGKVALEYVERILDDAEALRDRVSGRDHAPTGRVRAAAATQAFVHLFAPLFELFMSTHTEASGSRFVRRPTQSRQSPIFLTAQPMSVSPLCPSTLRPCG
jgi:DNA-binding transcriptional LysR family regulator